MTSKRQVFRTFFVIRDLSKAKSASGSPLRTIFVPISRDFFVDFAVKVVGVFLSSSSFPPFFSSR